MSAWSVCRPALSLFWATRPHSFLRSAIDHLCKNKTRPSSPPYPEYLKTNRRLGTALGDEIDATIDAGEARAKEEALTKQLDDSGK
jgi:hypothetical protein